MSHTLVRLYQTIVAVLLLSSALWVCVGRAMAQEPEATPVSVYLPLVGGAEDAPGSVPQLPALPEAPALPTPEPTTSPLPALPATGLPSGPYRIIPDDESFYGFGSHIGVSGDHALVDSDDALYSFQRDPALPQRWRYTGVVARGVGSYENVILRAMDGSTALIERMTSVGEVTELYARDVLTGTWQFLTVLDPSFPNISVAGLSGDTLALVCRYNCPPQDAHSVALYQRDQGGPNRWGLAGRLFPNESSENGWDLNDLVLVGDTLFVSARVNTGASEWSVYLFERGLSGWRQTQVIIPPSGDLEGFGSTLASDGRHLVVTDTNGKAELYRKVGGGPGGWQHIKRLTGATVLPSYGDHYQIDGDLILLGGWMRSAHLFERHAGGIDAWGHTASFTETTGASGYGVAIGLSGNDVLVSASRGYDEVIGDSRIGAVYAYAMRPDVQASPDVLSFEAVVGEVDPPPQTITLLQQGSGQLLWTPTVDSEWLRAAWVSTPITPATLRIHVAPGGLDPGVYQGHVTLLDRSLGLERMVPVTLRVSASGEGRPYLRLVPRRVTFTGIAGDAAPDPLRLAISNAGGGDGFTWSATSNAAWLQLNKREGRAGESILLSVLLDGLAPGQHDALVRVTATADDGRAAGGSPQEIPVTLLLAPAPQVAVTPQRMVFRTVLGEGDPAPTQFVVTNVGGGTLTWNATASVPWLSIEKNAGGAPESIRVHARTAGLPLGTHQGSITIESAQGGPKSIAVELHIEPNATLALAPTVVQVDVVAGGSTTFEVQVGNSGAGTLGWNAISDTPWLVPGTGGGSAGPRSRTPVQMTVDAATLEPRLDPYSALITVNGDGEASPQTVAVQVTVDSKARYCRTPQGGSIRVMNTSHIKAELTGVQVVLQGGGCTLAGTLNLKLPQNANLTAAVSGVVSESNVFVGTSARGMRLRIANFAVEIPGSFSLDDQLGLVARNLTFEIPAQLGGGTFQFNGTIKITPSGVTFNDQKAFAFKDLRWGSFSLTRNSALLTYSSDGKFKLSLTTTMGVKASGSSASTRGTLVFDEKGLRTGSLSDFALPNIAGFTVDLKKLSATGETMKAAQAALRVPTAWGGASGALYGFSIGNNGALKVSGGEFRLPNLKVGGDKFRLTDLRGKFENVRGGRYRITGNGQFSMSGLDAVGSCSLKVKIVIETSSSGATVLTIHEDDPGAPFDAALAEVDPLLVGSPDAINAMSLRELVLRMRCSPGIAIGSTGFYITGLNGTIELTSNLQRVELGVIIESKAKVNGTALMSAEPTVTIWPKPFKVRFNSPVYIVGVETERTIVEAQRNRFTYELHYTYPLIKAGLRIETGKQNGRFYFAGDGWANIQVEKGEFVHECARVCIGGGRWKKCWEGCLDIPTSSGRLGGATARIDMEKVRLAVDVMGITGSATWDFGSRTLSFGSLASAASITSAQVEAARQNPALASTAEGAQIAFLPDGSTGVGILVPNYLPAVAASSVITAYTQTLHADLLVALLQPVTGTMSLSLIRPDGTEIRPGALPADVYHERTTTLSTTQEIILVPNATPGVWRSKVSGNAENIEWALIYTIDPPAPQLVNRSVTSLTQSRVRIGWTLLSPGPESSVSIYATERPVTTTLTVSGTNGLPELRTLPSFTGIPLVEAIASPSGIPQAVELDLAALPSGSYAFWIEARLGDQIVRCFVGVGACPAALATVPRHTVDQSAGYPTAWEASLTLRPEVVAGTVDVRWLPHPHPDVAGYQVRVYQLDPLTPTLAISRTWDIGAIDEIGAFTIDGIEPGETIEVALALYDSTDTRVVWSQKQQLTMEAPGFVVRAAQRSPVVIAGGVPVAVPLVVSHSSNLPYPILLDIDGGGVPDGLYVEIRGEALAASGAESAAEEAVAAQALWVSASDTLPPGRYALPLIVRSGRAERHVSAVVSVVAGPGSDADTSINYLPLIQSQP